MALINQVFQPLVQHHVPAPAHVQFAAIFTTKAAQHRMPVTAIQAHRLDQAAIDRGLVDGTGRVAVQLSLFARVFQNGRVSRYAGYFVAGVVFLTVFVAVLSLP
ncbi:MAG: hypothetical protein IIC12_07005, partial [Proteobacteria bacterium]|nr:hypothetical protein [Pseudomonadota bacterium]